MRNKKTAFLLIFLLLGFSSSLYPQSSSISGSTQVNKCETNQYTITIDNTSGQPITNIVVTNTMPSPSFSYVSNSSSVSSPTCNLANIDPSSISGSDLIWNIDTLCGAAVTLNPGQQLTITFSMETDCSAVSGSNNVHVDYDLGGNPSFDDTSLSIRVLPGAITIKKNPNVIPAAVGDTVTWTLRVENTGLGKVVNVEITDVLGAGLSYVSSTPAGNNIGQTTTWDSGIIPGLADMDPGEFEEITLEVTVSACENLDNTADAKWGCSPTETCYDTAVDGGTATAAIQLEVKNPDLDMSPPDFSFTNYCDDTTTISFPITNNGDGNAQNIKLYVDWTTFTVDNVTAPATYNTVAGCFENIPDLAPGGSFTLEFDLSCINWCTRPLPTSTHLWQPIYEDDCGNEFYPPVGLQSCFTPPQVPSLSVSKTGGPAEIQIGSSITYHITIDYSGVTSCGSGTTGDVTIVDTVPHGFTVTTPVPNGGVWVDSGDGTGGTVTWTYNPTIDPHFETDLEINLPGTADCETYCFTTFTNTVDASVTDCCGCDLTASASQSTAIECEQLVNSEKTVVPSTAIRCSTVQYTNTYIFEDNPVLDTVDLSQLVFTEQADNEQEYVPGSLSVTLSSSGDITACALSGLTDTTPGAGGNLVINFSNCNTFGSVKNKTLTITYQLDITEDTASACSGSTFYSWSSLDLNITTGACLQDGVIHETTQVTIDPPAMSISIYSLTTLMNKCQTETVSLTITQTSSTANPKDVMVVLSGLNYYIVNPASTFCTGIIPLSCTPGIDGNGDYVWAFLDSFTGSGQDAVIQFDVQKRCTGSGDLTATVYYDDLCNDDYPIDFPDEICSSSDTYSPLLLSGDLLIEKTPEVYYATTNTVEFKIYVTNRGTGTAYNVWIDDVLGAGLDYNSAVVDNMTGVTITADQDHSGGAINGVTISINEMAPAERREISLTVNIIDCDNLTNDVSTSWGCNSVDCQTPVTDSSTVLILSPNLVNINVTGTPINACATETATITIRNAGQVTLYNLQVTETLPIGLTYVDDSTQWRVNAGGWNGPDGAYDPVISGFPQMLQWTSTPISTLASIDPGDIIEIQFQVYADCTFSGGQITVNTSYETPCGESQTSADSVYSVVLREPDLSINKIRTVPPEGQPLDCNQNISWAITVINNGTYTIPIVWVEDTLGAAFTYVSSTGDPVYGPADNGFNIGQNVYWEIKNLPAGQTATLTLDAITDAPPVCVDDLDNTYTVYGGCGDSDGLSSTDPRTEMDVCLFGTGVTGTHSSTRQPGDAIMDIIVAPMQVNACDDDAQFTVTVQNNGPTDASNVDLVITLPPGLVYNAGLTTVTCPIGGSNADPTISGNQLIFYDVGSTASNLCNSIPSGGTATLVFSVHADCFVTSDLNLILYYYDCCGNIQYRTSATHTLTSTYPDISVTITPDTVDLDCYDSGDTVTWTIQVNNTGAGNADLVRIEYDLGANIAYDSSNPPATNMGGGVYGWEIGPLTSSNTITVQLTAHLTQSPYDCYVNRRRSTVNVYWGCAVGGVDGDPTTADYDCEYNTSVIDSAIVRVPDLTIYSDDITAQFTCTADGNNSATISATVRNEGDGPVSNNFYIQISDNHGRTTVGSFTSFGGTLPLAANSNQTISIDPWPFDCMTCSSDITVVLDNNNDICECGEGNNSGTRSNIATQTYNLKVNSITAECEDDGLSTVHVQIENDGCQDIAGSFNLYLEDDQGNSATISVSGLAAGSTTTVDFTNWPNDCTASVNFTATVDSGDAVCECDGTDNTLSGIVYSNTSPDLTITSVTPSTTCIADGNITGTIQVTIQNQGNGPVNTDFRISVNDGQGWTSELWYNADLGGTLPLAAGASETVTFNWTRSFTAEPYVCDFNITATVDSQNDMCECTTTNNAKTDTYNQSYPNLRVLSITPTCTADGVYSIDVVVENNGCMRVANVVVRLEDNDGNSSSQNIGTLNLVQQTVTFPNWPVDGNPATLTFTATIDPADDICELNGTDNSMSVDYTRPNLDLLAIDLLCIADENHSVRLVIWNTGSEAIPAGNDFMVQFSDNDGNTVEQSFTALGGSLPFNAGTNQIITFTNWPVDCDPTTLNFTGLVDSQGDVCESIGTDNTTTQPRLVVDLEVTSVSALAVCNADGDITGTIQVTITNTGGAALRGDFQVRVSDGQGWTSELWFFADLGATWPFAAGASETLTFNWTRSFTAEPYVCDFNITATVDSQNGICECTTTNNAKTDNYSQSYPNLRVLSITPTCTADGVYSIDVVVENNGCMRVANVVVRLEDNDGNSSSQNIGTLNLVQQTVTFSNWPVDGFPTTLTFTATIDPADDICELNGTDNSMSVDYAQPNLELTGISPYCIADENYAVALTIWNTGSGAIPAGNDFMVQLSDNDGNTVEQSFTALGGSLPFNAGTSQTITFTNWPVDCDPTTLNFTGLVDSQGDICEGIDADNTTTQPYLVFDLEATSVSASAVCNADGDITGTIQVTITNTGGAALRGDFQVRVSDGQGWTSELWFFADLGATWPFAAGASETVTFNWTRSFTAEPYICNFNITATVDSQNNICECTTANNATSTTYDLLYPNLRVLSITPTCAADGVYSIDVVVDNNGCTAANSVVVRMISDCGLVFPDQVVNLPPAAQQTITFISFLSGPIGACMFTAVIDPGNIICEFAAADNVMASPPFRTPNLDIVSITPECVADENYRVSIVIESNGSEAVTSDFRIQLSDNDGHTSEQWFSADLGGSLPFFGGLRQTIIFSNWMVDCDPATLAFNAIVDSQGDICESNAADNTGTGSLTVLDLEATSVTASTVCSSDGSITGTITVTVTSTEGNAISSDFRISVNDGQGWNSELWYQADLGGALPIAVGASESVTFNWTRNFTAEPYICNFNITATVDSQNDICECTTLNNATTNTYIQPYPNLRVLSITPSCIADGQYSIDVVVDNNGCGSAIGVVVQLSDNDGQTQSQTINIAAGAQLTLTFAPWPADGNPASLTFTAIIDPGASICELSGTDNSITQIYTRPNLTIISITPECLADENYQVSILIENNGSEAINSDFMIQLSDNDGNTFEQSFIALGGSLPFNNGIQQTVVFSNWPVDCDPTIINFTATVDSQSDICESNAIDNTGTQGYPILDLEATAVTPVTVCSGDGNITGTIAVTATNTGGDPVVNDFQIRVDDGQGWNAELWYNADLSGALPLAVGTSETVTFNWTRDFTAEPYICDYTITAVVDSQSDICECTFANNTNNATYHVPLPDFTIDSMSAGCDSDGRLNLELVLSNIGCEDISTNFDIRISDNAGHIRTETFTALGGSFPFGTGTSQTLTVEDWEFSCANPTIDFNVVLDPRDQVCELNGDNNTFDWTYNLVEGDLRIDDITWECNPDGSIDFEIRISNRGYGDASGAVLNVYDPDTARIYTQTFNLSVNGSTVIKFTTEPYPGDRDNTFRFVVDQGEDLCECNRGNNEREILTNCCSSGLVTAKEVDKTSINACEEVEFTLTISNVGGLNAYNLIITDELADGLNYVPGSTNATWASGNYSGDPAISGNTLQWTIEGPLNGGDPAGEEMVLSYKAQAGACTSGRRTFTNTFTVIAEDGSGTAIPLEGCDGDDSDPIDSASAEVTLICPSLNIERSCPEVQQITLKDTFEYTIIITNNGDGGSELANIEVKDEIPDGWTLESFTSEGAQPVSSPSAGSGGTLIWSYGSLKLHAGETIRITIRIKPNERACGTTFADSLTVSATDNCGTAEYSGEAIQCPLLVVCGMPVLELEKICPRADEPGGIYRFELILRNRGDGNTEKAVIEDTLPDNFQYVPGSTVFDGQAFSDPQINGQQLVWNLGIISKETEHTLSFSAIAPADTDPGRYCNNAQAKGYAPDGSQVSSDIAECYTILRREAAECCLQAEEQIVGSIQMPEGPLSFIEPYFKTEEAMFTSYAALHFWQKVRFEDESLASFIRERLKNYALSTIEELYLRSQLGILLPDGSLWLAFGGAYPQRTEQGWVDRSINRSMTPAQLGFELLALKQAIEVEDNPEIKDKLKEIIHKKLLFLEQWIDDLPHDWRLEKGRVVFIEREESGVLPQWKLEEGNIERGKEPATIYDCTTLLFSMVELRKAGYATAEEIDNKLRAKLQVLDNDEFNKDRIKEELFYILAIAEFGNVEQPSKKIEKFEELYNKGEIDIDNLYLYALASYVDYKVGGSLSSKLFADMKDRFYLGNTGIFADIDTDFTHKISLESIAALLLAFEPEVFKQKDFFAVSLCRMIEETGLFLKQRNIIVQRTPLTMLRNYPFVEKMLPILSFNRGKGNMAPVFTEEVIIRSAYLRPFAENVIPLFFSKVFSPNYEYKTSEITMLSYALQYMGSSLMDGDERIVKEEGRSLHEHGRKYVEALIESGAGINVAGATVLPYEVIALKGAKEGEFDFEPLNTSEGFRTATIANMILAEKLYVESRGEKWQQVVNLMGVQINIVKEFEKLGYIPATFRLFMDNDGRVIRLIPSEERASKSTIAKLFYVLEDEFLKGVLESNKGMVQPEDMILFSLAPELSHYFEEEIRDFIESRPSLLSYSAADVLARRIFGLGEEASLDELLEFWDVEIALPRAEKIESIARGSIYHYEPQDIILYLLAIQEKDYYKFRRTLDFFTCLLEGEWGVTWEKATKTLPAAEYWLLKELPKENIEPGDLLTLKARVENRCPMAYMRALDLPSLFLKADFVPPLIYAGTEYLEELNFLRDFLWSYEDFVEGGVLEYIYQALIPKETMDNYIEGTYTARGYTGYQPYGPESASGDYCEAIHDIDRLPITPLIEIEGLVFEDRNVNGRKDAGERGIPGIMVKDTRGRIYRSDAEGRLVVLAGDENVAVQIELKSVSSHYVFTTDPTRVVNRQFNGVISFGLVPCITVKGFVYRDDNGNDRYDEGEERIRGVMVQSVDKETISSSEGMFIFRNLPVAWKEQITIKSEQPYYDADISNIRIHIEEEVEGENE